MKVILTSKHNETTTDEFALNIVFEQRIFFKNLKLISISYPYSFYNLRESNNKIIINDVTYIIQSQNYSSLSLALYINSILPVGSTCVFDKSRLRYIFKTNAPLKLKFENSYKIFGFYQGETYEISDELESYYIPDINDGLHFINFTSNQLASNTTQYNNEIGRIFATLHITRDDRKGDMLFQKIDEWLFKDPVALDHITVDVVDDNQETLFVANTQWSMVLEGEIDYKEAKLNNLRK
jgi:hypothetical protein